MVGLFECIDKNSEFIFALFLKVSGKFAVDEE